jgi:very-short-patch-repair endonuclease
MAAKITNLDADDLCRRYMAGEPEQQIAKQFGVSRPTITRILTEQGIQRRGISEANKIRLARIGKDGRSNLISAFHAKIKGKRPDEFAERYAVARQKSKSLANKSEDILAGFIRACGIDVTQQKAVGIYNLDIALEALGVAVEVFGGNYHSFGSHERSHNTRCERIFNEGLKLLVVWTDIKHPITKDGADQVIAIAKVMSSDPSPRSKYRMIYGDGREVPKISSKLNDGARVERLCGSNYAPAPQDA